MKHHRVLNPWEENLFRYHTPFILFADARNEKIVEGDNPYGKDFIVMDKNENDIGCIIEVSIPDTPIEKQVAIGYAEYLLRVNVMESDIDLNDESLVLVYYADRYTYKAMLIPLADFLRGNLKEKIQNKYPTEEEIKTWIMKIGNENKSKELSQELLVLLS